MITFADRVAKLGLDRVDRVVDRLEQRLQRIGGALRLREARDALDQVSSEGCYVVAFPKHRGVISKERTGRMPQALGGGTVHVSGMGVRCALQPTSASTD